MEESLSSISGILQHKKLTNVGKISQTVRCYSSDRFLCKLIRTVSNFRFSKDEMTRWGRIDEGVHLSDDSGYLGTLMVFHELHCLVRFISVE